MILLTVLMACGNDPGQEELDRIEELNIRIYGSNDCGHCDQLREEMDALTLQYQFIDIYDSTTTHGKEIRRKLKSMGYKGSIKLPIVLIDDTFLMRPDIEEIRSYNKY